MEIDKELKYWVIEFVNGNEYKWIELLDYCLPIATHVEFNILYSDDNLKFFLEEYSDETVVFFPKKKKLYSSGTVLRMPITQPIVNLLYEKGFYGFKDSFVEDPSLYQNEKEMLASISHENQIYINPEFIDLFEFSHFNLEHKLVVKEERLLNGNICKYFKEKWLIVKKWLGFLDN